MAAHWLFCFALLILFLAPHLSKSDDFPDFRFSWPDDDDEFYTNDSVAIKVQLPNNYKPEDLKSRFKPEISVNDTKGNSTYITDLHSDFGNDTNNWQILFKTIMAGFFHVLITDDRFKVHDTSLHFHVSPAESYKPPHFLFGFPGYKDKYKVGDIVDIKVETSENFNTKTYKVPFNPDLTVSLIGRGQDERTGNSSFITGVYNDLGTDPSKFMLHFIPIMSGNFNMWVSQFDLGIGWNYLHYEAAPGQIHEPGGIVSWRDGEDNFVAGTKATVIIQPKDAFGNSVTSQSIGKYIFNGYEVFATHLNGSDARVADVINYNYTEHHVTEFTVITSGTLLLHVAYNNTELVGSPLTFTVDPGPLEVANCMAEWRPVTKSFQLFSTMETFVIQRDRFGNLVPGIYDFNFEVNNKGTGLSVPIGDLKNEQVAPGVQLFSFQLVAPGEFGLSITDKERMINILNIPFIFSVFIAYCDGLKSIVKGSGLHESVAGEVSKFTVELRDAYDYPSSLDIHLLRVEITLPAQSVHVEPRIHSITLNDTRSTEMLNFGAFDPSVPSVYAESDEFRKNAFEVEYVPEKTGSYEIRVFCGNIPLNADKPYRMHVSASGKVNGTNSRIVKYDRVASHMVEHAIDIELKDSFNNSIVIPDSRMSNFLLTTQGPKLTVNKFVNHKNGSYTCFYVLVIVDLYYLCIQFEGVPIEPYLFTIDSCKGEDFPKAYDDEVSCWEDESIGFYPLANDKIFNGETYLIGRPYPSHGSIVVYGNEFKYTFRYTPYKRFYGNDSFTYTINHGVMLSSAQVKVFVLTIPPQFVTFPRQMYADEDKLSPQFGGFPGFELTYSNSKENISVAFTAKYGSVVLSPLLIQLWDPMWDEISITRTEGKNNELILTARLEVINFAIKYLKYIGEGNFSGEDTIRVTTINKNAKRGLDIPIIVNPINDPPFINAPEFIMLGNVTEDEGYLIYDTQRDNFNFSIGDPDYPPFPEKAGPFRVMLSVEVSSGYFSTNLPAVLISTTELKLKDSNQWQPLYTFVEISKEVTVKARAIRITATIPDCNNVLQQIIYYGDDDVHKPGGVLKVSVNDLGWYGRYPDNDEMLMSVPLITEATIKLVKKTIVEPVVAHSLGSVIVVVSILLSMLAVMLIFFTCKCVYLLLHRKVKYQGQFQNMQPYELKSSHSDMSSKDSSDSEIMTGQHSSLSNLLQEESGAK